jgi:hypothetical protein
VNCGHPKEGRDSPHPQPDLKRRAAPDAPVAAFPEPRYLRMSINLRPRLDDDYGRSRSGRFLVQFDRQVFQRTPIRACLGVCCAGMNTTRRDVATFLMRHGHRSFCARCVVRAVKARSVPPIERAMEDLGKSSSYRVEEGDCGRCERTTLTIRALWTGTPRAATG